MASKAKTRGFVPPDPEAIQEMLAGLLGVPTRVSQASAPFKLEEAATGAEYLFDDDTPAALVLADLPFAARAGALLGMIPLAAAEDAEKEGALPPNLAENFREVMNIFAQVLSGDAGPHTRFTVLHTDLSSVPEGFQALGSDAKKQACYAVQLSGDSAGRLLVKLA